MERKIYLIFSNPVDTVCEIKGYICGTEKEAQAYCEDLNKVCAEQKQAFVWRELAQLPTCVSCEAPAIGVAAVSEMAEERSGKGGYISATKAAEKWGVSRSLVCSAAREGRIPGAEFIDGHWHIPEDAETLRDKRMTRKSGYISSEEAAEKWDSSPDVVGRFCREGRISGAKFIDGYWHIPEDTEKPMHKRMTRKSGYISPTKAAEKWEVSPSFVCNAAREGRISGAEFVEGKWHIPENAEKPARRRGKRKE